MKKILLASDHAGFQMKKYLMENLSSLLEGLEFTDLGPFDEKSTDYPDYSRKLSEAILSKTAEQGILVCGSGQGMAMQANRYKGIRAALCWDLPSAKYSRLHNNANVLCLGGQTYTYGLRGGNRQTLAHNLVRGGPPSLKNRKI